MNSDANAPGQFREHCHKIVSKSKQTKRKKKKKKIAFFFMGNSFLIVSSELPIRGPYVALSEEIT